MFLFAFPKLSSLTLNNSLYAPHLIPKWIVMEVFRLQNIHHSFLQFDIWSDWKRPLFSLLTPKSQAASTSLYYKVVKEGYIFQHQPHIDLYSTKKSTMLENCIGFLRDIHVQYSHDYRIVFLWIDIPTRLNCWRFNYFMFVFLLITCRDLDEGVAGKEVPKSWMG